MSVRISGSASRQRLQVDQFSYVMAGIVVQRTASLPLAYVPAIRDFFCGTKTWMPGTRPGMT
jgi:uncharacterized membrane protein